MAKELGIRHCIGCGRVIELCNGFCLARDFAALLDNVMNGHPPSRVRETCGPCTNVWAMYRRGERLNAEATRRAMNCERAVAV